MEAGRGKKGGARKTDIPPVRVPGPARDGVVHERAPRKYEEHQGPEPRALRYRANREHRCNGGEHELIHAKHNRRDPCAADAGLLQHAAQRKVFEVAHEAALAFLAECQGEAPEEPLEGHDREAQHAEVDHAQCVLAAQEARVEEADTGDHYPDEGGGSKDPGDVAEVVHERRTRIVDVGHVARRVVCDVDIARDERVDD